jgi:GMP synthase (glutamine-hydrolysing)
LTLCVDTIETGGTKHSAKIKTHHNRVDAITKLLAEGRVVEPLRELYKDEVRALGKQLGLPAELVMRHPFPGPGLAVRILCAERADYPAESGKIAKEIAEFLSAGGVSGVSCAVLPVKSVGVQGDARSYRHAVALYFNQSPFTCQVQTQLFRLLSLLFVAFGFVVHSHELADAV